MSSAGVKAPDSKASIQPGPRTRSRSRSAADTPFASLRALRRARTAILGELGVTIQDLTADLDTTGAQPPLSRKLHATQNGPDLIIHFDYTDHKATYRLAGATLAEFDGLLRKIRDGLARTATADEKEVVKTDSVAAGFLHAVHLWPTANPSDLWWFLIYRAYFDPFNHPASESRRDFGQSWKRTAGWALEQVLVRHYGPWLDTQGVRLFIAPTNTERQTFIAQLTVAGHLESDKADVLMTTTINGVERCFGVVHVKASFAERRTDDVPMSKMLVDAGYTSPLWTMDCKSMPSATPINRGELGAVLSADKDQRSAKRKDIEDDGYFSACFSYNRNTLPTPAAQETRARIMVCGFRNPDDAFGQFILGERRRFVDRSRVRP